MNKNEKSELASALKDRFSRAKVAIFADYKGLTAVQADDLRKQLREHRTEVKVLKNNVARLVSKDGAMGAETREVMDSLVGPTLVAFSFGDPAAAAKVMHKYSQENEAFKLKDSLMGQRKMTPGNVEELAKLPGRDVLLGKLLGSMNAPIGNFVGVLAAVPRSLLNVLVAVEKKKSVS